MSKIGHENSVKSESDAARGPAPASAAASSGVRAQPPPKKQHTYVLVHGAWHGGWCWKKILPLLRAAGHDVHAPTLTGLGYLAHVAGTHINLETHVQDILMYLEMEDLHDVVLVGHSYAGMVITGVADRVPSRLRSMIYVDAFLPESGKAMIDYTAAERRAAFIREGLDFGMSNPLPLHLFGLTSPRDIAWVAPRLVKQSFQTFFQPIRLFNNAHLRLPRTYVYCTDRSTGSFDQFAAKLRNDPGWKFFEIKTGHDAMITAPEELAKIIVEAA